MKTGFIVSLSPLLLLPSLLLLPFLAAQSSSFHNAPASARPLGPASVSSTSGSSAPPPKPPFTDYRFEKPGTLHHINVQDLPVPFTTGSATAPPKIVARPANAWPVSPPNFKVDLFASGLT